MKMKAQIELIRRMMNRQEDNLKQMKRLLDSLPHTSPAIELISGSGFQSENGLDGMGYITFRKDTCTKARFASLRMELASLGWRESLVSQMHCGQYWCGIFRHCDECPGISIVFYVVEDDADPQTKLSELLGVEPARGQEGDWDKIPF